MKGYTGENTLLAVARRGGVPRRPGLQHEAPA